MDLEHSEIAASATPAPTGNITPPAAPGTGQPPIGGPADAPAPAPDDFTGLKIGEETYTREQVEAAFEAQKTRADWQAKLQGEREMLTALYRQVEQMRSGQMPPHAGGQAPMQMPNQPNAADPYAGVTGEDLRTMVLEDPSKFQMFLDHKASEILEQVEQHISQRAAEHETMQQAQGHFLGEYQNFPEVVKSREFQEFNAKLPVDSQGTPFYNPVNAYFAYELAQTRAKLAEAEKAGFVKGEDAVRKNLQAKASITILRGAGATAPQPAPPDLSNATHEDRVRAATQRIEAMRRQNTS